MTFLPKTINHDQTIGHAISLMKKLHIRHLPVMKNNKLMGILTDRDISLVLRFIASNPDKIRVEDACSPHPYTTSPGTPLADVVSYMAEHTIGSAIIVDNGTLVGIFTEVDAFRAIADLLETRLKA
tara:strand:- start:12255 stop:12632 length:378 start_codon:yes stop_codon:yes gene_type:complete